MGCYSCLKSLKQTRGPNFRLKGKERLRIDGARSVVDCAGPEKDRGPPRSTDADGRIGDYDWQTPLANTHSG